MNCSKEEILKNLLNKTFNTRIGILEKRDKEEIKSLQFTKKSFNSFEKTIQSLIKNVQLTKERKEKEKQRIQKNKSSSSRSKTVNNFHNQYTSTMPNSTIHKNPFTPKGVRRPLSKSLTDKQLGSTINIIRNKSILNSNKKKLINSSSNNSFTSTLNSNRKKTVAKGISSSAQKNSSNISLMKEPLEFRKELLSIQMQIKNVEHNILNTEKAIEHKKTISSMEQLNTTMKNSLVKKKPLYDVYLKNDTIINNILQFCNDKEKLRLFCSSKIFNTNHYTFLEQLEKKESKYDREIKNLKKKYDESEFQKPYLPFVLTRGAIKAVEFLDQDLYIKIFTKDELDPSLNEIIIIYRILYQLLKLEKLVLIKNDKEFWKENCNYLITESHDKLGIFMVEKSKEFCFDCENCHKLKEMIENMKSKIVPSYFSKICGTTGLIVFVVKDALEYSGAIVNEKKTQPRKIYENLLYEKEQYINKLKYYKDKIKEM